VSGQSDFDVGDIFAGCFLSLAGSLVGSVIGAVGVFILNFPEVGIGQAILRFAVGFVAGVVVGFIAAFAAAPLAVRIGRRHAENVWIGAVAVSAAIGAALTAWRLFPV
jgi:hypothetical protein